MSTNLILSASYRINYFKVDEDNKVLSDWKMTSYFSCLLPATEKEVKIEARRKLLSVVGNHCAGPDTIDRLTKVVGVIEKVKSFNEFECNELKHGNKVYVLMQFREEIKKGEAVDFNKTEIDCPEHMILFKFPSKQEAENEIKVLERVLAYIASLVGEDASYGGCEFYSDADYASGLASGYDGAYENLIDNLESRIKKLKLLTK